MSNEMTQEAKAIFEARRQRGLEAQLILSNKLIEHAFNEMEKDATETLKRIKPNDIDGRDTAWRELRAVSRFKERFEQYVTLGKEAEKTLFGKIKQRFIA